MVGMTKQRIENPKIVNMMQTVPQRNQIRLNQRIKEITKKIRRLINLKKFSRYSFGTLHNGKPDLCGSVWIIATLIVTIHLHFKLVDQLPVKNGIFFGYDFTPVYVVVAAVICYNWIAPLALLALIKWTTEDNQLIQEEDPRTVLSLMCLYAFTMSTYTYFPLMWILEVYWVKWCETLFSTLISACAVILWLQPDFTKSKYSIIILGLILAMYVSEAAVFVLYVFDIRLAPMSVANVSTTDSLIEI